jgi:hypothetical protein
LNRSRIPLVLPPTAQPSVADTAATSLKPPKNPVESTGTWVAVDAYAAVPPATTNAPTTTIGTAARRSASLT